MAGNVEQPIVLSLSNPPSECEAPLRNLINSTEGRPEFTSRAGPYRHAQRADCEDQPAAAEVLGACDERGGGFSTSPGRRPMQDPGLAEAREGDVIDVHIARNRSPSHRLE
jgi:hypothetical protein